MTFAELRRAALALPRANEAPHHESWSFRVDGRIFATVPPGETHAHLFLDEAARRRALADHPSAVESLHWGAREVGVRVDLAAIPSEVVVAMLADAWETRRRPAH